MTTLDHISLHLL